MSLHAGHSDRSALRLPPTAYASHVEALFSDKPTLAVGAGAICCLTVVTAVEAEQPGLLLLALAMAIVGLVRLKSIDRFGLLKAGLDADGLKRWERWYIMGGVAHVGLLGCFCVATFATNDAFARLASVAGIMAYLVGIPGRSFGSPLLVNAQVAAAGVPLLVAVLLPGHAYLWIWFLVFLPFLVALRSISSRLRGIFMSAVTRANDLCRLAGRFDTALNNMPHGLAMFADDGTVTVVNHRIAELMRVAPDALARCATLERLWTACMAGAAGPSRMTLDALAALGDSEEWAVPMADGRTIAFRRRGIASGGGVLIAEDVTERVRALEEVAYLASHDALTGLYNRRSFMDRAGAALARCARDEAALLFVDLDHFKSVNDTLGHGVGDRLIAEAARRLQGVAGPASVLARLSGDEFVVFGLCAEAARTPASLASAVVARLSEPYEIDGHAIALGASVGIAPSRGGADIDALLVDADLALHAAKAAGRGSFRFFEDAMQARAQARRELEDDLRQALGRGEFEVHYQPIFSLAENAYTVCEALVRWRHARRGLVSPAEFIPIAEEIGLIHEIGGWVLARACAECASWPCGVGVAVNVSAVQFRHGDLLALVRDALQASGLAPTRLEIEVTETALLQDIQATATLLRRLREVGVGVSLDDFGTGYSSLSYLQSLPFSKVKIDRSFLDGAQAGNRAMLLLGGIARLSVALGMTVVVEGVETGEQLALVASQGCVQQVQGFLFSRPVPADQVAAVLRPPAPARGPTQTDDQTVRIGRPPSVDAVYRAAPDGP